MKRKIMDQSKGSEIRSAIEELSVMVKVIGVMALQAENGGDHDSVFINEEAAHIPTRPFLSLCTVLLQVLDKIGPTMAVLRQDIHQNIRRLETRHESDPSTYSNMVEILKKEATDGIARNVTSCSRALVWLTRSLDFTAELLQNLAGNPGQNMKQAVEQSYNLTLKPWHRWISSAASKIGHPMEINPCSDKKGRHPSVYWLSIKLEAANVALLLVPDNETFISSLMAKDESYDDLKVEMETLVSLLVPCLEQIHSILRFYHLDKFKAN